MGTRGRNSKSTGKKPKGGRVTPKGGPAAAQAARARAKGGTATETSKRYTAPTPRSAKQSPTWWPYLMFGLLAVGMLIIILNYAGALPGGRSGWWLLPALGCITAGIVAATNYR
jgi:hypothetical protein